LDGRVGLSSFACSFPHDSLEILISCHGHASHPRDEDPQRLHPRAGCLIRRPTRIFSPLPRIMRSGWGGSKEVKRVVSLVGSLDDSVSRSQSMLAERRIRPHQSSSRKAMTPRRSLNLQEEANSRLRVLGIPISDASAMNAMASIEGLRFLARPARDNPLAR
jgi:hypothetical protein